MSKEAKTRPNAHIFEKWVRGIKKAVPNDGERCKLYEYIIAYQLAKIYGAADIPNVEDLSTAAAMALAMLEGDLEELCEVRLTKITNPSKKDHNKPKDNESERKETDANEITQTETDGNESERKETDAPQKQKQKQEQKQKQKQEQQQTAGADAPANGEPLDIFELGLNLLRKGYKVDPKKLQDRYWSICNAKAPYAYAASVFAMLPDQQTGPIHAFFIESTQTHNIEAFGIYGVAVKKGLLEVRLRKSAAEAIGEVGKQQALKKYAELYGVTDVEFVINGDGT